MDKKQLNFSAPLMSARRYSSPLRRSDEQGESDSPLKSRHTIDSQPSDAKVEEVVNRGSVPFMWEQTPGKAKGGNESQVQSPDEVHTTPKLPPNMPFPPGKRSGELNGFRTPNMLSGELRPRNKVSGELNVQRPHKFSGELHTLRPNRFSGELKTTSAKFSCSNDGMVKWDSSKEGTEMNGSSESDDDNATFSDAIETFSQHESLSINCSFSGVSASERPEIESSDNLPTDPKARDFMMNRFLPAAKAMTIEPSQYASRKQLVAVEQSKEVKALVPRAKTPPPSRNICNIVPYTGQDIGSEESEEEEEEDSYDGRSALSVKVKACGFLPWFCSKNSLRFINPLPSMKDRSKSALSSASKLSKFVKTKSWRSPSRKLVKHDSYAHSKHKVSQVHKSCELQKPKHTSRPMFYSGELQTRSGSPYRSSRRSVSPFRNESPQSVYQKGVGFLAVPKRVDSFEDNQSKIPRKGSRRFEESGRKTRSSGTRTPTVEKTLYVDSVNITKVSHSILNLPKNKRQVEGSVHDAVRSETSIEHGGRMEIMKARGMSGPLVHSGADPSEPFRISEKGNTNSCRELVLVPSDDTSAMQSTLTPPLPQSPSESWLSRQVPSASPRASPRNSVSYSSLNSKVLSRKQNAKTPTSGAKWETIVKSSHLRQDHGRFSEELITHVPQKPQRRK